MHAHQLAAAIRMHQAWRRNCVPDKGGDNRVHCDGAVRLTQGLFVRPAARCVASAAPLDEVHALLARMQSRTHGPASGTTATRRPGRRLHVCAGGELRGQELVDRARLRRGCRMRLPEGRPKDARALKLAQGAGNVAAAEDGGLGRSVRGRGAVLLLHQHVPTAQRRGKGRQVCPKLPLPRLLDAELWGTVLVQANVDGCQRQHQGRRGHFCGSGRLRGRNRSLGARGA